jgi:hypothetical protein
MCFLMDVKEFSFYWEEYVVLLNLGAICWNCLSLSV